MTMQPFAAVVAAVNATNGVVVDDHRGAGERAVYGIATLVKGDHLVPVALVQAKYFSLNLLYLGKDGKAHISRDSVGGCVEVFDNTMDQAILNYNESQTGNLFCSSFLANVHYLVDSQLKETDLVSMEKVAEMQATAKEKHDAWNAEYLSLIHI